MNSATIINQHNLKQVFTVNQHAPCIKQVKSKHSFMMPEVAKTRLFRLPDAPEKPPLLDEIEQLLRRHGFREQDFRIGITGFGDVKTHLAEIGLVSTTPGFYNLHLGGNNAGNQLNKIYSIHVSEETVLHELDELLCLYKIARQSGETFGEFVSRKELV